MRVYFSDKANLLKIVLSIALFYSSLTKPAGVCAQTDSGIKIESQYQLPPATEQLSKEDPFNGLILGNKIEREQITQYLDYYIDETCQLNINTVASEKFAPHFKRLNGKSGFGYSSSSFWFRIHVNNITDHPIEWFMEYPYAVVDHFIFYQLKSDESGKSKETILDTADQSSAFHSSKNHFFSVTKSGDAYPFAQRPVNFRTTIIPITQMPGKEIFYFNIRSNGAIVVPLVAWGKEQIAQHMNEDLALNWLYYGFMLAAVLYNVFIFISVRELTYLYMVIVVVGTSFFTMTHNGLAFQYLWPESVWWANVCHPFFAFVTWLGVIIFTTSFLSTKTELPRVHFFMKVSLYIGIVMLFSSLLLPYRIITQINLLFASTCGMAMIISSCILCFRGQRQARFYIIAWSSILISAFIMLFKSLGLIESNVWTDSGVQISLTLLVTILSFGLVDKINSIQHEKQKALDQVRASEKRYRLLADNVKEVIWTLDLKTLKINYITPSVLSMIGYTSEEAKEYFSFNKMLPPDSAKKAMNAVKTGVNADDTTKKLIEDKPPIELECYTKDGNIIWTETTLTFLRDEHNNAFELLGVSRDITERKLSEKEKKKLEDQLAQSNKLESMGTLAGGIAHDMNNILTAIMGYVEITLSDVQSDSKICKRLERVLGACYRARDLVKQILTFSRQESQENIPVNINIMIKEVLKLIRASLPATVKIHQNIPKDKYIVNADPTKIHQIIMNLCSNAGYAMEEQGGILAVCTEMIELDSGSASKYFGLLPGPYIRLTVSDTGHGMDRKTMERIFDPFFTTKPRGKGTGMGLAMVHGIVKSLGGNIYVYSEPGKGSTFHLFFPHALKSDLAEHTKSGSVNILTGNETLLYVDDETPIVEMAQEMLSTLGYSVYGVVGSVQALERFKLNPDLFDLVITDQNMPEMTGCELAKNIWAIRPDIPIILCSGFNDIVNLESARFMGINEYIMKPYGKQEMCIKIRKILNSYNKTKNI